MFKFEFNQEVNIFRSGEHGIVIGRAEYPSGNNNYYVRYVAADGRSVEAWWQEDALS